SGSVPDWTMPDWLRRVVRPREGWLAYFLLMVMLLSLAWSVQRAGWLSHQDFLVPVALYGSLLGALLALVPLSVVATLPISALAGTAVILLTIGGEYFPNLSVLDRLLGLRLEAISWMRIVAHFGYPSEFSPYAIGLAVAAPLTDAWRNLDGVWNGVRTRLDKVFGPIQNENARLGSTTFGSSFGIAREWFSSDDPVMAVSSDQAYYMQTVTYDVYTGRGWSSTDGVERSVSKKSPVFPDGSPEEPLTTDGFDVQRLTVAMQRPPGPNLFTPGFPLQISAPAVVTQPSGLPFLGSLTSQ